MVALDELLSVGSERGDRLSLVDTLEDKGADDPVAVFEPQELKHILAGAINRLGEREKIVITLYDYEGLTLAEIGQVLGVTESPVCQMPHQGGAAAARQDAGCPLTVARGLTAATRTASRRRRTAGRRGARRSPWRRWPPATGRCGSPPRDPGG